ncbi:MAG TPA: Npt1/Npt2 family nucleotide transporter [Candidatus Aminicenantes bacterium]|nr:Npt1/Npt2 family nucleotide transporter [Candidatus Aminicenantes bacterium]HRY65645.1 Npt1/Npt2 family nucleotide transporter [Candidatus Aminicenantes bacterium]HRZ72467.1 Npt1/Npt2 family nucleotide transporter [Candidatus Aminicenantes bacterium]
MPDRLEAAAAVAPPQRYSPGYRFLRLFADIRPGEAPKALLLGLNVFLLLLAYYILKPLREALLLVDKDSAVVKSCLSGAQAVLFVFVVKAFSRLSSRVPRHVLITWTTSFFISNLALFYLLDLGGMAVRPMGILFFIWIGIFNYFVIAQFWGFANDLYSDEAGKRAFPLVALGATSGGLVATLPFMKRLRDLLGSHWEFKLMLLAGIILFVCILLARHIHRREVRAVAAARERGQAGAGARAETQEMPLRAGGGFRLVFRNRYLLLIALMIGLYNFVNATGEYIITTATVNRSIAGPSAASAPSPAPEGANEPAEKAIHDAFMDYQFLTNLIALVIQLFLVSRIFKWIGVNGALLVLPLLALGGYALISFGAVLGLVRWVKALENGTDYSLQNTTKAALFLVTRREEKYKAKAAIDTFFVRGGDTLSALAVLIGTGLLGLPVERFALLNVVAVIVLLAICLKIIPAYAGRKAATDAAAGEA